MPTIGRVKPGQIYLMAVHTNGLPHRAMRGEIGNTLILALKEFTAMGYVRKEDVVSALDSIKYPPHHPNNFKKKSGHSNDFWG